MADSRLERLARILMDLGPHIDGHSNSCGDRVVGVAISGEDFDELGVAEIWGVPVLASEEIGRGRLELLCESKDRLIPRYETVQDILDHCQYRLRPPGLSEDAA